MTRKDDLSGMRYPDDFLATAPMAELAGVTVLETSTTWTHGFVKCIMHSTTKGGVAKRTVKVIDMRTRDRGMPTQWDGSFEEFLAYAGSLDKLFPLLTAKRHEDDQCVGDEQ